MIRDSERVEINEHKQGQIVPTMRLTCGWPIDAPASLPQYNTSFCGKFTLIVLTPHVGNNRSVFDMQDDITPLTRLNPCFSYIYFFEIHLVRFSCNGYCRMMNFVCSSMFHGFLVISDTTDTNTGRKYYWFYRARILFHSELLLIQIYRSCTTRVLGYQ